MFLPASRVRSSTCSPPAQPVATPSAGSGDAIVADQTPPGLLEDLLAERNRELAADSIPRECDASVPETHDRSSQRSLDAAATPGRRPRAGPVQVTIRSGGLQATLQDGCPRAVETLPFGDVLPVR